MLLDVLDDLLTIGVFTLLNCRICTPQVLILSATFVYVIINHEF